MVNKITKFLNGNTYRDIMISTLVAFIIPHKTMRTMNRMTEINPERISSSHFMTFSRLNGNIFQNGKYNIYMFKLLVRLLQYLAYILSTKTS